MLFEHLFEWSEGGMLGNLFIQFFHHPWNGLRFWDLIQPGFMFMAGTAMAFSLTRQTELGLSWNDRFIKILKRSGCLFFWGVLDYAVRPKGLSFVDLVHQYQVHVISKILLIGKGLIEAGNVCESI